MSRVVGLLLLLVCAGVPLALVGIAVLAIEEQPLVVREVLVTPGHVARAKALVKQHDPRSARDGQLRAIRLSGEEVDLLANYVVNRFGHGSAAVSLEDGAANVRATAALVHLRDAYLNIDATVVGSTGLPRIERLEIGRVKVPSWVANAAMARALQHVPGLAAGRVAADAIESFVIADDALHVNYRWQADLPGRLTAVALPTPELDRLRDYYEHITRIAPALPATPPLAGILRAVLTMAAERAPLSDAVAENRAAIIALALYANGEGMLDLLPAARDWPRPVPRRLLLRGRHDLSRHFLISAALAATAGTPLADAVGLYKEIEDARDGSGFSFSDLAADRAGTSFGQIATRSTASARRLQQQLTTDLQEADFMPEVSGLADNLREDEFKRRFGAVGAPAYRRAVDVIERRIAACRLYRQPR